MRAPEAGGPPAQPDSATRHLALTLYRLRLERGISLRQLAKALGYSSHSVFADFERARRIPDERLLHSLERHFDIPAGALIQLRRHAMVERAAGKVSARAAFLSTLDAAPTVTS